MAQELEHAGDREGGKDTLVQHGDAGTGIAVTPVSNDVHSSPRLRDLDKANKIRDRVIVNVIDYVCETYVARQ
ncbi:hypothetical protein Mro03_81620 [Microbispora rosea subsp. rosea]|nr:hypothetical protein Mro03_81620 [Microbispora rosea subsp. rosea]